MCVCVSVCVRARVYERAHTCVCTPYCYHPHTQKTLIDPRSTHKRPASFHHENRTSITNNYTRLTILCACVQFQSFSQHLGQNPAVQPASFCYNIYYVDVDLTEFTHSDPPDSHYLHYQVYYIVPWVVARVVGRSPAKGRHSLHSS